MKRLLGTVSGGKGEAERRLEKLQEQFSDYEFEIVEQDNRVRLAVDWKAEYGEPAYDTLRQAAQTHVDSEEPKEASKGAEKEEHYTGTITPPRQSGRAEDAS